MPLADRLDQIRAEFRSVELPDVHRAALDRNIERLEASGVAGRILGVGDRAPEVTLLGNQGDVRLSTLLDGGPVVLTWFRGAW